MKPVVWRKFRFGSSATNFDAYRRHRGRLSARFLPPQSSLYNSMQAIIGAELRERYDISEQLPSDLERLLKEFNNAHSTAEPPESSSSVLGTERHR
jgi:hypothetical protein